MRRLLTDPRWWGLLAMAVVLAISCILLGRWQFGRWEDRLDRNAAVAAALAQPAVPAADLLAVDSPPPADVLYRTVTATGTYDPDSVVLVRNRPLEGRNGYRMLAGLRTEEGPLLVVDRGWIPAGITAAAPDEVPPLPAGTVAFTGRVRPDEPVVDVAGLPDGQAVAIASAVVGADPRYQGYAELMQEQPAAAVAPVPPALPPGGSGPHLIYALQWWFFGGLAVVGLVILSRRPRVAPDTAG